MKGISSSIAILSKDSVWKSPIRQPKLHWSKKASLVSCRELGTSVFCSLMNKVQVDKYAAGLHSKNSDAVNRYTKLGVKDRFILMCAAFDCNEYKVDNNLHII